MQATFWMQDMTQGETLVQKKSDHYLSDDFLTCLKIKRICHLIPQHDLNCAQLKKPDSSGQRQCGSCWTF